MTWLTWRLHRTEAAIGIPLLAILIAIMVLATQSVDAAYDAANDLGCFDAGDNILCSERLSNYFESYSNWGNLTNLLHGVPLAVAALLILPTLQELERGTHRLAWTQSISRRRWSLIRIGFVAGVAVVVALVWASVTSMWRTSVLRVDGLSFWRNAFELSPAVLVGYGLFAVALGIAAAVALRRLIPTLAILIVGFVGTRILTTFVLRERYRSPIEETTAASVDNGQFVAFEDRWVLDESWVTATGQRVSWERVDQLCMSGSNQATTENAYQQCLVDNNLHYYRAYHPTDRVTQFQFIETALYLGLAVGLFALAYWWLTRRAA